MPKISDIAAVLETFAPLSLQESYDNCGLQVGEYSDLATAALLCLDVTERTINEALARGCNLIISHHPLLFGGIKKVTDHTERGRIIIEAIRNGISIYSAHTNLDRATQGVSMEMSMALGLHNVTVLEQGTEDMTGLGAIGSVDAMPTLEFLRKVKEAFHVKCLRYSASFPSLIVKRIAVCGGAGTSMIQEAVKQGADVLVTGDVKYHDFTSWGRRLLIVDVGHYESELCTRKMFSHILADAYPDFPTYISEEESNPVNTL